MEVYILVFEWRGIVEDVQVYEKREDAEREAAKIKKMLTEKPEDATVTIHIRDLR